jgi:hypothetical protein
MILRNEGNTALLEEVPPLSRERLVSGAANGITLDAQHHRGGTPAAEFLMRGLTVLPDDLGLLVLSEYRRRLAHVIAEQESKVSPTLIRDRELRYLETCDESNVMRWLFASALFETLDDMPNSMSTYATAMRLAREQGASFIQ